MYLVKIHNVYNYRNYHEFGKQECLCACVYVWRVGPEPVGARQWPWKPRTWGDSGAALRCHTIERLSLKRSCLLTGTECHFGERTVTCFYFRALVRVHLCSPNPPSNAALAFPSENLSWLPPAHWGRDPLLRASVSVSGWWSSRSKTSTTPGFLSVWLSVRQWLPGPLANIAATKKTKPNSQGSRGFSCVMSSAEKKGFEAKLTLQLLLGLRSSSSRGKDSANSSVFV